MPADKTPEKISAQVAALLKEEREKQGLSLNELSQRAGLARQTISYVEQEVQNPTLNTLLRITEVLNIDLEEILTRARERASSKRQVK